MERGMETGTSKNERRILLLVLLTLPIGPLAVDLYTPSLPYIVEFLNTTATLVQLSITIFIFGLIIGELILGTISDSYGRKKILLFGLLGVCVFSMCVIVSPNILVFCIFKFLQGVACASPMTLTRAISTDTFKGPRMRRAASFISVSYQSSFVIGPIAGGYLQHYTGWKGSFVVLAAYTFLIFSLMLLLLPETNTRKIKLNLRRSLDNYKTIICHRPFIGAVLIMGSIYCVLITFYQFAPFIIQKRMHYGPVTYGHIITIIGVVSIASGLSNTRLIRHFSVNALIMTCALCALGVSAVLLAFELVGLIDIFTLIGPVLVIIAANSIMYPNAYGECLRMFPAMAGAAASLMGVLTKVETVIVSGIASHFSSTSVVPVACAFILMYLVILFGFYLLKQTQSREQDS